MSDAPTAPAVSGRAGGKKKIIVIALAALVLAGGGAGAWVVLGSKDAQAAATPKKAAKPLFTTLEPFTVNLQDARGERFAQIGITLQFEDSALEMQIKDRLPALRNAILLLISSKQIEELLTTEGKQKLAEEIRAHSAEALGLGEAQPPAGKDGTPGKPTPNPIQGVLFSQFIVQ